MVGALLLAIGLIAVLVTIAISSTTTSASKTGKAHPGLPGQRAYSDCLGLPGALVG